MRLSSANTPPSPSWSARRTNVAYFSPMMSTSIQKMILATPAACAAVTDNPPLPKNTSFSAYRGDVPRSPYTIPKAPKTSTPVDVFWRIQDLKNNVKSLPPIGTRYPFHKNIIKTPSTELYKRKREDSNLWYRFRYCSFQDCCLQPLGHAS